MGDTQNSYYFEEYFLFLDTKDAQWKRKTIDANPFPPLCNGRVENLNEFIRSSMERAKIKGIDLSDERLSVLQEMRLAVYEVSCEESKAYLTSYLYTRDQGLVQITGERTTNLADIERDIHYCVGSLKNISWKIMEFGAARGRDTTTEDGNQLTAQRIPYDRTPAEDVQGLAEFYRYWVGKWHEKFDRYLTKTIDFDPTKQKFTISDADITFLCRNRYKRIPLAYSSKCSLINDYSGTFKRELGLGKNTRYFVVDPRECLFEFICRQTLINAGKEKMAAKAAKTPMEKAAARIDAGDSLKVYLIQDFFVSIGEEQELETIALAQIPWLPEPVDANAPMNGTYEYRSAGILSDDYKQD